jgi:hypothetical protein
MYTPRGGEFLVHYINAIVRHCCLIQVQMERPSTTSESLRSGVKPSIEKYALSVLHQLSGALAHMHSLNMVTHGCRHCDLSVIIEIFVDSSRYQTGECIGDNVCERHRG